MKLKNVFPLLIIIFIAFLLRSYGMQWDSGYYLHPDERAIVLFTIPLALPNSFTEFFSSTSPLNPHFFAYGNLPLYLLKITSSFAGYFFDPLLATYEKMFLIGRPMTILFEIFTVITIYKLGLKLKNSQTGLLAAFFYTISVLPIQLAHFYTVDTILTFFVTLTLYYLIHFYEKPTFLKALLIGILLGAALATKNSALLLIASIGTALGVDFILVLIKRRPTQKKLLISYTLPFLEEILFYGIPIIGVALVTFLLFEPYAFISFQEFFTQTLQQYQMTHNAFTFPYTLQYIGKIPYWHEIKNIFLWGQGPLLSVICFSGIIYTSIIAFKKDKKNKWAQELILVIFFWVYFITVGNFAIGFMRYMLPVYPILCICGALIVNQVIVAQLKTTLHRKLFFFVSFVLLLVWPLSYIHIYSQPNTRVQATRWINKNIPLGSSLATEHWDDVVPLASHGTYTIHTLSLYDPESPQKWEMVKNVLDKSDYIVISSNRLYVPLQKLTDCTRLPQLYCYPQTAQYYKDLFSEKLGYKKIIEFSSYPTIPFVNLPVNDDTADESFTVYDHPKVFIFKKILEPGLNSVLQ